MLLSTQSTIGDEAGHRLLPDWILSQQVIYVWLCSQFFFYTHMGTSGDEPGHYALRVVQVAEMDGPSDASLRAGGKHALVDAMQAKVTLARIAHRRSAPSTHPMLPVFG